MKLFTEKLVTGEFAIALLLSISFVGLAIPYGFPLFSLLLLFFVISLYIQGKFCIRLNIEFIIIYLCILFYFIGIVYSDGIIYKHNKVEITNIISFSALLPIMMSFKKSNWSKFINFYNKAMALLMLGVSILSIYKFYLLLNGIKLNFLLAYIGDGMYPWGTSLVSDYNMFSYAMFAGIFASTYCLSMSRSIISQIFYFAGSSIMITAIIWSGSRRGWIVLALLSIILICYISAICFIKLIYNQHISSRKVIKIILAVLSIGILIISLLRELISSRINSIPSGEFANLVDRFSTIYGENASLVKSFSDRTILWEYAKKLIGEYSLIEFLLGKGFDYLTLYGEYITNNFPVVVIESYPHNPIISAIHYSGLIGAVFVTLIIILPIIKMYEQKRLLQKSGLLSLYAVSLLFLIPTLNTIFSIKPFLLLIGIGISLRNKSHKVRVK